MVGVKVGSCLLAAITGLTDVARGIAGPMSAAGIDCGDAALVGVMSTA